MKQIVKSQIYELKSSRILYLILIILSFLQISLWWGEYSLETSKPLCDYIAQNGGIFVPIALAFGICFTGFAFCNDFLDKTVNYEILNGHRRKDVYFSRAIISIIGGTAGTILILMIPLFVLQLFVPFGTGISNSELVVRLLIAVFPIARIICEIAFLAIIIRNPYVIMAAGFAIALLGGEIVDSFVGNGYAFLGLSSLSRIFSFAEWSTYTLSGKDGMILIFESSLQASEIAAIIGSSILFGSIFLILGYLFFKKDDLK